MSGSHGRPDYYEDGDQRRFTEASIRTEQLHHGINAEGYRPADKGKVMNEMREEDIERERREKLKTDPTYPAMRHGHEPSRGAKVDAAILAEEQAALQRKEERERLKKQAKGAEVEEERG